MLKNIQRHIFLPFTQLLSSLFDVIAPERNDYKIVRNLTRENIVELPKAPRVEGLSWINPLFHYKDSVVKSLIWELKYKGTTLPLEHVSKLMFDEMISVISDISLFDTQAEFLLVPIPISNERRSTRGYNQSEYIARSIVEHDTERTFLYAPQWFEKIKDTAIQSKSATKTDRLHNLEDCFRADPRVAGYYVFLIDDVVTTGSTLSEARKTLLGAGVIDVFAFTIAH